MEQEQITLEKVYYELKKLESTLQKKNVISKEDLQKKEMNDWAGNERAFADEELLSESWLSPEDEKAFAYLQ